MLRLVIIIMDTLIMGMVVMDMVMDTARGKLKPPLLLKPRLPQDIIIMATPAMDMEDMDTMVMAMERGRLRPMLLLRLDTIMDTPMATPAMDMEDMDTMDMVMERERPRLRLDTITDTPMAMVAMDTMDTVMARGRLSPVIIMDTPMDMATMDMVVMDTMVKQQLFIGPTNFSKFDLDLSESSQKKHTPDIKNIKIHSLK